MGSGACETPRLNAQRSTYERRKLRHELEPQIRKARDRFTAEEWESRTEADLEQHARWVARRLLDPSITWRRLADEDPDHPGSEECAIRRACLQFARQASLVLPSYGPGRIRSGGRET